ncbi:MAG TPA: hypothetical protein VKD69_07765 [Vicinamibacterales bacterium]|nr:hypothetical protein [Vicinamibacterales bacterium]
MSDTQQSSQLLNVEALRYGVASAQATAVLAASVHAAEAEAFRQLIWRRLAIAAAIWLLLGVARVVPPIGLAFGLAIFGAVAAAAGVLARRAGRRLLDLIAAPADHRQADPAFTVDR